MIVVIVQYTLVSLLIARTNFSEFSDDGIIAKNSTPQLLGIVKQILKTLNIVHANTGGYSTKSPVSIIFDPRSIFQIAPLPTYPLRHFACYNDIHNQNLNIHTVNYMDQINIQVMRRW